MKKGIFAKLGAVACVLTLVTTSLVGGTFAKYTSSLSGTATATIAKWDVKLTDGTNSYSDSNKIEIASTRPSKTIAPGDSGHFDLVIDASATQVDVDYEVKLPDMTNEVIKFTKADGTAFGADDLKGNIPVNADPTKQTATVTVYWSWPDVADNNAKDTEIGANADGVAKTYSITVEAVQHTDQAS